MSAGFWTWLVSSDAGLLVRVAAGVAVLAGMAAWELHRKGRRARRWREYVYLAAAAGVATAYGMLNDQVTATVSWEYFYYGKLLAEVLGPGVSPPMGALRWEALKLGAKAAWTVGLILGVVILIANNPRPGRPGLPYRTLYRLILWPLAGAVGCAVVAGVAGYAGTFAAVFTPIVANDLWRPSRFMCAWGIHLGGYFGAAVGGGLAVWRVRCLRKEQAGEEGKTRSDGDSTQVRASGSAT